MPLKNWVRIGVSEWRSLARCFVLLAMGGMVANDLYFLSNEYSQCWIAKGWMRATAG